MRYSQEGSGDFTHIRFFLDSFLEQVGAPPNSSSSFSTPVPTGFPHLDELLGGGLQRSELIVLAARPNFGKSTLALNIARNAADFGFSAALSIPEMSGEQIAERLLASGADINTHRLRMNLIREDEEVRVLDAVGLLFDMHIYVDDTPFQSVVELRDKSLRLHQQDRLDLLIVDYLQLVDVVRNEDTTGALGEVSRLLKLLARELEIPVLACWQLSRKIEQTTNHRPLLSDLQESGPIDEYADTVVFIHREDKYISREEWHLRSGTVDYPEGIAEIIVAKHRNGPIGAVPLSLRSERARFETMSEVRVLQSIE